MGLRKTTGGKNKIRVLIMAQEEGEGQKILDITICSNILARMNV
jgi:hypothetical protein